MTPQDLLDRIKTLNGYQLFSVMRQSRNKNPIIFNACFLRAKELSTPVGDWNEAIKEFNSFPFPTEKQSGIIVKNIKIKGYTCQISQNIDDTMKIKNQIMSLINHKTNQCIIRWGIRGGEVSFV